MHEDGIYTRRSCELYKGIILHDRDVWNRQYTRVGAIHRCLCRVKNSEHIFDSTQAPVGYLANRYTCRVLFISQFGDLRTIINGTLYIVYRVYKP